MPLNLAHRSQAAVVMTSAQFGRAVPATGFALKTNRILDGVQGEEIAEESPILIRYTASCRKEGLAKASELRAQGHTVITSIIPDSANIRDEGVPSYPAVCLTEATRRSLPFDRTLIYHPILYRSRSGGFERGGNVESSDAQRAYI